MIPLIWVVLSLLGLVVFIMCATLVELHRTIDQVRSESGALDNRTRLEVAAQVDTLRSAGLPGALFSDSPTLLLVLSDRCGTCNLLGEYLLGGPPPDVWILLQPLEAESATRWLNDYDMDSSPRVIIDTNEDIVDALNIRVSPAAIRLRGGQVVAAHTVPSPRRLREELRWLRKGGPDVPTYGPVHESFGAVARQTNMAQDS